MANHVCPFQISKEWTFGSELCEMWTMSDVLCCTASILHLLAIALDRSVLLSDVNLVNFTQVIYFQ